MAEHSKTEILRVVCFKNIVMLSFLQVCYSTVCKAHLFTQDPVLVTEAAKTFDLEYFEPYGETVNALDRALHDLDKLPDNFFAKFPNLQVGSKIIHIVSIV